MHILSPYPDRYVTVDMWSHGMYAFDQGHDLTDVLQAMHRLSPYPDSYVTDDMRCHESYATDQSHDLTDVLQAMHRLMSCSRSCFSTEKLRSFSKVPTKNIDLGAHRKGLNTPSTR